MLPGLRVLDLSWQMPGPYATKLLADLGADVISVEPPGGDPVRAYRTLFRNMNAGKRCMVADLKGEDDRRYVLDLAQSADVLVEGFRPGVADRLGVGYAAVSAINPRIVYCSVSGYGQAGEWARDPGHDLNYQALAGVLGAEKGRAPQAPFLPISDLAGGLMSAFSIAAACLARASDGRGERIDISMTATVASWMAARAGATLAGEVDLMGDSPHYDVFESADGSYAALGVVFEDHFWRPLCAAFGLDELAALDFAARVSRREDIRAALRREFLNRRRDDAVALLRKAGVPVTPVHSARESFSHFGGKWVDGVPLYPHPVRYEVHTAQPRRTELDTGRKAWS